MDEKRNNDEKKCENHNKNCKNKEEKHFKHQELQKEIEGLKTELELANKTINEQKVTINSYLSTASYYKNELDSQKKDFDRYKERNKNIELEANSKASENVIKKLLPIIDNFDQAITHVDPEVMKGFAMIYASLTGVLTDIGAVEIKAKGEKLNPEQHNCISTEETEDNELDGTVASVYQKGYMFAQSNKVIRPATVSIYKIKS